MKAATLSSSLVALTVYVQSIPALGETFDPMHMCADARYNHAEVTACLTRLKNKTRAVLAKQEEKTRTSLNVLGDARNADHDAVTRFDAAEPRFREYRRQMCSTLDTGDVGGVYTEERAMSCEILMDRQRIDLLKSQFPEE